MNRFFIDSNRLKRGMEKIFGKSTAPRRLEKAYLDELKKRNHNHTFSLITNNCVGGVICHNLGEEFRSPTVNLFISGNQYLSFCKNLKSYVTAKMEEDVFSDRNYPVGILKPSNSDLEDINIYFQHYSTFEEAYKKWNERCERIRWDNLFFIWEFYSGIHNYNHVKEFDKLRIKKAILLHNAENKELNNSFVINEGQVKPGKILEYDGNSGKRFLDQFDYVSFLNT